MRYSRNAIGVKRARQNGTVTWKIKKGQKHSRSFFGPTSTYEKQTHWDGYQL